MNSEPVKTRFKTFAAALDEVEKLERQVIVLNAQLAANKSVVAAKGQPPALPSATAANQPPAANPPVVERPLTAMSKRELTEVLDTANANGDKAAVAKIWAEYSSR